MIKLISRYKIYFFLAIVIIIICSTVILIFSVNKTTTQKRVNLAGYESLKQSLIELDSEDKLTNLGSYQGLKKNIISLENPNLTEKERFDTLLRAELRISLIYDETNNYKLYLFNDKLKSFAKNSFPKMYKEEKFKLTCSDPECANIPQPEELLKIIEEIKSSNLPKENKDSDIQHFTSLSYINTQELELRVINLYGKAKDIKDNQDYKDAGINIKIYNQIIDYLINSYPEILKKVSGIKNLNSLKVE